MIDLLSHLTGLAEMCCALDAHIYLISSNRSSQDVPCSRCTYLPFLIAEMCCALDAHIYLVSHLTGLAEMCCTRDAHIYLLSHLTGLAEMCCALDAYIIPVISKGSFQT